MELAKLEQAIAKGQGLSTKLQTTTSKALESLRKSSEIVTEKGVNALDLYNSPEVSTQTFSKTALMLKQNYGTNYSDDKMGLLFDMIRDDGWSEERFNRTLRWFLKNKPFPAWTIADWFTYSVPVYPYEWYLKQCVPGRDVSKEMDIYELEDGTRVYKWHDGIDLPLKKAGELTQWKESDVEFVPQLTQ